MAYSRVTRTKSGKDALAYAEGVGHGHHGNESRNEYIGLVNMLPDIPYAEQMERYWKLARPNHTTQVLRIVQSFSVNEFDPKKPEDVATANALGVEFAKRFYEGRQAVVFTQIDGASGLVHNHVIVNDVHMENYKGCDKQQYFFKRVEDWTNAVTKNYTELDSGKNNADKISQTERTKREQGEYVWKDDLKNRVHKAMSESTSEADYLERLKDNGVSATAKSSKKYGDYYTYQLDDTSLAPEGAKLPNRDLKLRSYNMGHSYGKDALNDYLSATRSTPKGADDKVQSVESDLSKMNEFDEYLKEIGESFITYDNKGEMQFDWNKYDELQVRFKQYKDKSHDIPEKPLEDDLEEIDDTPVLVTLPLESELEGSDEEEIEAMKKRDDTIRQTLLKEQEESKRAIALKAKHEARLNELMVRLGDIQEKSDDVDYERG